MKMTSINERIDLLDRLGNYITSDDEQWENAKIMAANMNAWFTPESIEMSIHNIADNYLKKEKLNNWIRDYNLTTNPKKVGIVMAGNIPLVGFHDFLCSFISGHYTKIKLSSKDSVLLKNMIEKIISWNSSISEWVEIADNLKGCDAYIATGSNNTSRYFEAYFGKYPNIIRKNRTSVAILDGAETEDDIKGLGKDIYTYFGLGCRNISKIYVPEGYSIDQLLSNLDIYKDIIHHNKYKNNYDYYLAIYLLNKVPYLTNDFTLAIENKELFSPISTLHYEYYSYKNEITESLQKNDNVQCIVGEGHTAFGNAQFPSLNDYADGVDTMQFLSDL